MEDLYFAEPRSSDSLSFFIWYCCSQLMCDVFIVGYTVDEAVHLFVRLEKQCKVQLHTEAIRAQKTLIDKADAEYTANIIQNPHKTYLDVSLQPY